MDYRVGDRIRIKSWNEMVNEFGLYGDDNIDLNLNYCWPRSCERLLPQDRIITITKINIPNTTYTTYNNIYYTDVNGKKDYVFPEMIKRKIMIIDDKEEIMQKIKELESKTEELKSMVGNLDKKEWADTFEESKKLFPYWGFQDNYKYMVTPYGTIINADGLYIKSSEAKKFWNGNGKIYRSGLPIKYKFKGFNTEKELYAWMAE